MRACALFSDRSRRLGNTRIKGLGTDGRLNEHGVTGRLLVLSFHAPPDGAVGGLRWTGLSRHLARRGWSVRMLTASSGAEQVAAPDGMDIRVVRQRTILQDHYRRWRKSRLSQREDEGRHGDGRTPVDSPAHRSGGLRSGLAALLSFPDHGRGWVTRAARATRRALRELAPDFVISTGPPHSVHLAAGLGLLGTGVPWIVDLRDPWMTPWHGYADAAWSIAVSRRMERRVFRRASTILTTTPELRDALQHHYPATSVICLPNGVDTETLPNTPSTLPPGLSVTHLGSVYYNRDPAPVIRAFARFIAAHPAAVTDGSTLRFVGHISAEFRPGLEETISKLGIGDHVQLIGPVPRRRALELLAGSHMALVLAQGQTVMVPAKLYEAVGMGLPALVITEPESATGREARRVGAAVHGPEDEAGMARTMVRVWSGEWKREGHAPARVDHGELAAELEQILYSTSRQVGASPSA